MDIIIQKTISGNANITQHWKEKGFNKIPPISVRKLSEESLKKVSGNNHKTIRAKKS